MFKKMSTVSMTISRDKKTTNSEAKNNIVQSADNLTL